MKGSRVDGPTDVCATSLPDRAAMRGTLRNAELTRFDRAADEGDLLCAIGKLSLERIAFIGASGRWIAATPPFLEWLRADALGSAVALELGVHAWVDPDDWDSFDRAVLFANGAPQSVRFRSGAGETLRAGIRVTRVPIAIPGARAIRVEPASACPADEGERERRIVAERRRTIEAVRSNLRIVRLTERIRDAPRLTSALLRADDESGVFRIAGEMLSDDRMGFTEVTILLVEEGKLRVRFSTRPERRGRHFRLDGESPYARIVRGEGRDEGDGTFLLPLATKDRILGVLEVAPHPEEDLLDGDRAILRDWQRDVLGTVADTIALLVENHRLYERIRRQSIRDPLTDAYNRSHFEERLDAELERAGRSGRPVSLVFIDVDRFKALNDTYGHGQGDDVLRGIAALLLASTRDEDCVCRYGGDEFVVLLPEADRAAAEAKAERFRKGIESMSFPNALDPDAAIHVTVSCGVASFPGEGEAELLAAADLALYRAKRTGRNRVSG